jgi:hypothetical protein
VGAAYQPTGLFQGFKDMKAFSFLEGMDLLFHGRFARKLRKAEVVGQQHTLLTKDDRSFKDIGEFPHISWPIIVS